MPKLEKNSIGLWALSDGSAPVVVAAPSGVAGGEVWFNFFATAIGPMQSIRWQEADGYGIYEADIVGVLLRNKWARGFTDDEAQAYNLAVEPPKVEQIAEVVAEKPQHNHERKKRS